MDQTTIDTYDNTAREYAEKVRNIYLDDEMDYFMSLMPRESRILDLGCGSGRDARYFSDRGYNVIGVDLSENLLDIARENAPDADFRLMDIAELDFQQNYFDGIWANASIIHVPKKDLPEVLYACYDILHGIMYASFKIGEGEQMLEDKRYENARKFYAFYSMEEIEEFAKKAGFEVLKAYEYTAESGRKYATQPWGNIFLKN